MNNLKINKLVVRVIANLNELNVKYDGTFNLHYFDAENRSHCEFQYIF